MKLAEALVERKAAQQKLAELNERLQRAAVVQEGERPAEEPAALLTELDEVAARLERLILAINNTNGQATLADGRTLTAAIARRDVLRMRQGRPMRCCAAWAARSSAPAAPRSSSCRRSRCRSCRPAAMRWRRSIASSIQRSRRRTGRSILWRTEG